ncbi:vitellogenin-like [Colletes gigas]|uniref:vitellogenin-like n=1 Tax=Colletes gigas TaxID=935657 RepID=UPI001C9ABEB0|nr:vitellogenin-like [Colletes gigas]
MLAIILPFFLAARMAVDEEAYRVNDWQEFSPECIYDVAVNISTDNIYEGNSDTYCSMIMTELKCRPIGSDTLTCRFANGKILRPNPENSKCPEEKYFTPVSDNFIYGEPFEIRFNAKGIENLVVSRHIPRWRLNMVRAIVDQLNIGFELEKGRQRFVTTENSRTGSCEVEIKMSRAGYSARDAGNRDLEIVFEPPRPEIAPLNRAILQIEKVRDPKNCPNRKTYFFGNNDDSNGKKNMSMDKITSVSHFRISEREMHSYTESTGVVRVLNDPMTMRLYQKISLTLRSIHPTRNPLPEIRNPASTSLYAYTNPWSRVNVNVLRFLSRE